MKTRNATMLSRTTVFMALALCSGNLLAQAQTLTTLHSFTGANGDGEEPFPQHLTFDSQGAVYGTTVTDSGTQNGTVFKLVPPAQAGGAWKEHILYNFQGWFPSGDGSQPQAGVVFDPKGNLYGTTEFGGYAGACGGGCGTAFELAPPAQPAGAWTETVIYTFGGGYDGWRPGELVMGPNGSLYGTTPEGGTSGTSTICLGKAGRSHIGCGTVFELTPPAQSGGRWTKTILHNFPAYAGDGIGASGLAIDSQGNLYATAGGGGSNGYGMVFKLTPPVGGTGAWTQTVLYEFTGGSEGEAPYDLVFGPNGVLYGTAYNSGYPNTTSIVFQLTPPAGGSGAWTETVLHAGSESGLSTIDPSGNLYGTNYYGGSANCGTIFKLAPPSGGGGWTETDLHDWPCSIGSQSSVVYHNGLLYGTNVYGGSANLGLVFTLVP